jgi:hypothetical protein
MGALALSRDACRAFALNYSWENSARQFIGHACKVATGNTGEPQLAVTITETAHG